MTAENNPLTCIWIKAGSLKGGVYRKRGVVPQIWLNEIIGGGGGGGGGGLFVWQKYHNAGIWSMDENIPLFMFQNI